jgi:phosphate-selective porin OprO/OprP
MIQTCRHRSLGSQNKPDTLPTDTFSTKAPESGNPTFGGYFITGTWIMSGEMRDYDRRSGAFRQLPIAQSVYDGGKDAWEMAIRFSAVDLSDGGIDGGEMGIYSLGLNWWATSWFIVGLNYRYVVLDRFGPADSSS